MQKKNKPQTLHLKKNLRLVTGEKRVDEFVREWLSVGLGQEISKSLVRKWILVGAVTINRRAIKKPNALLPKDGTIEANIRTETLIGKSEFKGGEDWSKRILFEDDWIIVVDKPRGLPTQQTLDPRRAVLFGLLKEFLIEREKKEVYLGLHHRLDKDTSGVILLTKSKDANLGISEQFKNHTIQKHYLALTQALKPGTSPGSLVHKSYLARDASQGKKMSRYRSVKSGGDYAETALTPLAGSDRGVLWEASPKTGRTHQIRVHLSELGFPIVGDVLYLSSEHDQALCLHAMRLTFTHPINKKTISIHSPIPQDFLKCLERYNIDLPNSLERLRSSVDSFGHTENK